MPGASLALFADLGACHVQKSSVTICVLPAPSGWRATFKDGVSETQMEFLSTPSGWRATKTPARPQCPCRISIHALRVEGDIGQSFLGLRSAYFYPHPPGGGRRVLLAPIEKSLDFYPRPPGGGRHIRRAVTFRVKRFLSTPSGWRATVVSAMAVQADGISIHALRVEGDVILRHNRDKPFPFLSTPSGWRATA